MTCGLAVEWLRSCYSGRWRLFRNRPDVVTPGYYYRAADDTPFYDGWHNFWSSDWTHDRETPYVAPDLGEDRTGRTGYYRGGLPVALPDARAIGDRECFAAGDVYPKPNPGELMLVGIPATCWDGEHKPHGPPELPWIWHRPETLTMIPDGSPLTQWANEGWLGTPLRQPAGIIKPTVIQNAIAHLACVEFARFQRLDWRPIAPPTFSSTVFLVAQVMQAGRGATPRGPCVLADIPLFGGQPQVGGNQVRWGNGDYQFEIADGDQPADAHLYMSRTEPGFVQVRVYNGVQGIDHPAPLRAQTFNGIITDPRGSVDDRLCRVCEILIYPRLLTPGQVAKVIDYLRPKYGL